jgi:hypothetical protein
MPLDQDLITEEHRIFMDEDDSMLYSCGSQSHSIYVSDNIIYKLSSPKEMTYTNSHIESNYTTQSKGFSGET